MIKIQSMDRAQIDEAMARTEQFMGISMWVFSVVGTIGVLAVIAGVFMFIGNVVFGGTSSYKKLFSITTWSWLIRSLGAVVMLPLVLSKETMDVSFSLATLLPNESQDTFLYYFLNHVELFTIAWIAVYSIGLATIYKMKTEKMATAVVVVYVLYAVISTSLGGMFT